MRKAPIYAIVVVAVVALLIMVAVQQRKTSDSGTDTPKKDAKAATIANVQGIETQSTNLDERITVTGTLKAADEVVVGPRVAGRIAWIIGKTGTPVKKGHVVARLENQDAQTQIRAAEATLKAAEARVAQAEAAAKQQATATDSGILTAQAAVAAAKARHQQAKSTLDAQQAGINAGIRQAEEALNAAQSRLTMLKNGARTQERAIAENNVRLAEATWQNDKAQYERLKHLYEEKAIAKSVLDNAEAKMQITKAQYDSACEQLKLVQEGPREEEIKTAEAAVKQSEAALQAARARLTELDVARDNIEIAKTGVSQAEAALKTAQSSVEVNTMRNKDVQATKAGVTQAREALSAALQNLDYTMVYSPVDGVVAERMADVGQSIGGNAPVLKISTNNALYFEAQLSELKATRVHAGQTVVLSVDALQGDRAGKGTQITGTVESVVPVVDARTRNFTVRIVVPRGKSLFPGMFARGEIIIAKHTDIVAVPRDAIIEKGDQSVVFVVDGDVAHECPVALGATNGKLVQIKSGLSTGQQLVTTGQQTLLDGDKVKFTLTKLQQ